MELTTPALTELLQRLGERGYQFVPPTPSTHRLVVSRSDKAEARSLRDIFGWSLAFAPDVLDADMLECMRAAGALERCEERFRSTVRVASLGEDLFLHSAFPPDHDAVFFGPDSYRFAAFLRTEISGSPVHGTLVDIGAGSGVGAVVAARLGRFDRIVLTDVNPRAVAFAKANGAHAGVEVTCVQTSDLDGLGGPLAMVIANPPFIADNDGPTYRNGGDMHGAGLSYRWAVAAAAELSVGGVALIYTASAIIDGEDRLKQALQAAFVGPELRLSYREIDPDIFGDELARPAYANVERIAAVGVKIERLEPAPRTRPIAHPPPDGIFG